MSAGGPVGGDRVWCEGRVKAVFNVTHPTWNYATVATWHEDKVSQVGHSRAEAKMAPYFANDFGTEYEAQTIDWEGDAYQLYPKITFGGTPKKNADVMTACQEAVEDMDAWFTAQLLADGFTITKKKITEYEIA